MSAELTEREREYLACETPMISAGQAASGLLSGFFIGLLQSAFSPGYDKGDSRLIRTSRLMRYTRYKKAVIRKTNGDLTDKDIKTLKKLNKSSFILDDYDADAFTARMYEEYMNKTQP